MAPHNAVDPSLLNFGILFLLVKSLLNIFKSNHRKYFCTICYIFLAHCAHLSCKVEGLNFDSILIKSLIFAEYESRLCPAKRLTAIYCSPRHTISLVFSW